jgi:hypothetical protein
MRHFGKGFLKDIALLLIFTIVVGSGFSSAVAYAIDTYFGDTISSLAGEYGENQLIVHVRQEAKAAAEAQLRQLLQEEFPGAKLKEGIVIAGTANFFIRLPQSAITREVFSNLGKYFNDLPGQSGYTVLLEPTVIVEGVQGNIYGQLIEEIENLAHVRFAFRQGGQIYVLLTKPEYSKQVTDEINRILARDQIVELRFPQGYKVDSASVGDQLASALSLELNTQVKNVSSSGKNAELDSLMETLTQLKGFLESYATKVELTVEAQSEVKRGCLVSFGGQNIVGEPPGEGNLVAKIQTVSGQKATGIIQKGNSQTILGEDGKEKLDAYLLQDGVVQAKAGQLLVENNKVLLAKSLGESKKLLTELAHTSREAEEAATASLATIETFQETKAQVEGVERLLSQLNELLASPLGSARQAELDELMELATKASAQTGKLLASKGKLSSLSELEDNLSKILALLPQTHPLRSNLEGLTAALGMLSGSDDWSSLAPQLTSWRSNLAQEILKLVRADRDGKKEQVAKLLKATRQLTGAMAQMDPSPFVPSLKLVAERAQAFSKIDLEGIGEQASKLQSALPELSDEKIATWKEKRLQRKRSASTWRTEQTSKRPNAL